MDNSLFNQIAEIENRLIERILINQDLLILSNLSFKIAEALFSNASELPYSNEQSKSAVQIFKTKYQDFHLDTKRHKKSFELLMTEKAFVDLFQAFEICLLGITKLLFRNYPKSLDTRSEDSNKISVSFSEIFEQETTFQVKENIIERKSRSIIESTDYKEINRQIQNLFGFEFFSEESVKDRLFIGKQLRNVIVHNDGIVDERFMNKMKGLRFESNYQLFQNISEGLEREIENFNKLIQQTVQEIRNNVLKRQSDLDKRYKIKNKK
ncbi:hypothetical protein [Leptospira yasudae]|uniref:RiboL-PSP-HEPN domain-containing protein n=1 Tax=Leptospira yasudae TaxID=2202201 RepID=A0A6N4QRZ5_9LEPT|nr:hypothetical protein [Leptospira yasudae]TGL75988.1 hypothetical protein EHQ72_14475 [Leptospira yasudae]TGL79740.1 hypothetical protein EHQ83_17875 [Leptospira yasudae]TGL80104.1 hypothetical protein EHQ77_08990 [Leptospira yasudae]